MKFKLCLFLVLCLPFLVQGQNARLKNGFGINQDFHDYNVRLLDKKITSFDSSLSQSLRVSYSRYLSRTWGVSTGLTNGFLLNQTQENRLVRKSYIFGGDIDLIMKLNNGTFFKQDALIAPYLSFGYNINYLTAYNRLGLAPLVVSNEYGIGFNLRLGPKSMINIMGALDQQLNGDFDTHVQYRLGFAQAIGKEEEKKPEPETTPIDYDKDGIADVDDNCPTIPGISAMGGCPENWAESGEDAQMQDSMLARLDEIDEMLLALESELEGLKEHKVVEVECLEDDSQRPEVKHVDNSEDNQEKPVIKDEPTPVVEIPKSEGEEEISSTEKEDKTPPTTEGGNVEKPNPDKSTPKQGENAKEGIEDQIVAKTGNEVGKQGVEENETPGFDPLTGYKSGTDKPAYYVVAISTKDSKLAERAAAMISQDYPIVKILPQPNGYYRVGVYATKTKSEALKVLDYAKSHGIPSGWIAYE